MATDADSLNYVYRYLWRTHAKLGAEGIKKLYDLADKVFTESTDEVVITSTNYEGGSASGEVRFNRIILGQAIEMVLKELDPDYKEPPAAGGIIVSRIPFGTLSQET